MASSHRPPVVALRSARRPPRQRRRRSCCHARSGAASGDARRYRLEPSHHPVLEADAATDPEQQAIARFCAPTPLRSASGRIPWAELIARTFPDALDCPKCGATLSVIAYLTEITVVRKILEHLGLPAGSTELTPARLPDQLDFDRAHFDPSCRAKTDDSERIEVQVAGRRGRAPPFDDTGL